MISVDYCSDTDSLLVEGLSDCRASQTVRVAKPGIFMSIDPKTGQARLVLFRLAAQRLGPDLPEISNREACQRLAAYLTELAGTGTLTKDQAAGCRAAARSLAPEPEHAPGSPEHDVEALVLDATFYGDTTAAGLAHRLVAAGHDRAPETPVRRPTWRPSVAAPRTPIHEQEPEWESVESDFARF